MEALYVLKWWLVIEVLGLVGLPLAFGLLGNLPGRGYPFARPLGLLLTGYVLWLGGSFGLLRNGAGGAIFGMAVVLVVGAWVYSVRAGGPGLWQWLRENRSYVFTVEGLFLFALAGWALFKAYNPNIETIGGEKWMEIAFTNAILRSDYFPPQDPWLAGFGISYYYFGYLLMATVTRLAAIPSNYAYNLFAPTLFALTLTGAFGLVYNLVEMHLRRREGGGEDGPHPVSAWFGLLGALLVGVMGNLEGLLESLYGAGLGPAWFWAWLDVEALRTPPEPGGGLIPTRFNWWWQASRVLSDYTPLGGKQEVIDEFPFFSFLLADVHPHVLTLPFVMLALALALNLLASPTAPGREEGEGGLRRYLPALFAPWPTPVLYAVCIGALGFLNTWDAPIYLGLTAICYALWRNRSAGVDWLAETVVFAAGLGAAGLAAFLPFYVGFESQASGILPNLYNPSRLPQFLVIFGPFLVGVAGLMAAMSAQKSVGGFRGVLREAKTWVPFSLLAPPAVFVLVIAAVLVSPSGRALVESVLANPELRDKLGVDSIGGLMRMTLTMRLLNPWTYLFLALLLGWAMSLLWRFLGYESGGETDEGDPGGQFVLAMVVVGLALPLSVECIFLRDNFGTRMNTVFKFYFQAWALLGLSSAYALYYVSTATRGGLTRAWQVGMAVLIACGMVYPVLAIPNKAGGFKGEPTLDGTAWVDREHHDDHDAIEWLNENAPKGARILEAPGSSFASYQYTGRVSALTGIPTLLGWGGHEHQWHGNYDEPGRREPDIETIYNTTDPRQALTLLDKYDITYVYVGPLERMRYDPWGIAKFDSLLEVAYRNDGVTIYRHAATQR